MSDLRGAWDAEAPNWIEFARNPDHDYFFWRFGLPQFLEMLPRPGRAVLDLGCGEGRLTRILRDRGYRVAGVEASPTLGRAAAAHGEAAPGAIADAAALPIRARSVGLVVAYMVLHDVDDLETTVREAARVLGGGGRLCFAIVHPMDTAGEFDGPDGTFAVRRSYFEAHRLADTVEREGVSMTFHSEHRPLERYARALEDAGFLIESVREPRPDPELVERYPSARRAATVPWGLFVRAIRALWAH